ncbi:LytR/AlgR family response regulator transcription factor [Lacihabitans soyangensis]|uniref:DNA-binding response regulator n=1 Tax=Lacihabitans soyangensis TaxID=869394 RepID=A0AAE3H3H7_9BACT|nr:LytTR family DNA-binding domain-containing protein [Lacihabitans soyangensis]MCP9762225.1 DNA-binding response regulator [Lacihabitans soyangensis]
MTPYSCIVVEDEPLARNLLSAYISKVPRLELKQSFSNALDALEYLRENPVDVLFSDIQMPEVTGITLLKLLKTKPLIILTTAYSEYALEGYELEVYDYLLKPISFERFLKAVEKGIARLDGTNVSQPVTTVIQEVQSVANQDYIFVKDGTKLIKINLSDILYIEGLKDYVCIYTPQKKIISLQTMKSLEASLPSERFVRVHNSFIIAIAAIEEIEKDRLVINKSTIPISDTYKKAFREMIDKRQIGG